MATCPQCKTWQLKENDFYCSLCGHALLRLDFPRFLRKYIDPNLPKGDIVFTISNNGQIPVKLELAVAECAPSYTKLGTFPSGFELAPGNEKEIKIPFDLSTVNTRMAEIKISVSCRRRKEEIACEIYPTPKFELLQEKFRVVVAKEKSASIKLPVRVRSSPLKVERIDVLSGEEFVTPVSKQLISIELPVVKECLLPVTIPPYTGGDLQLNIYCSGLTPPFSVRINLDRQEPPKVVLLQDLPTPEGETVECEVAGLILNMFPGEDERKWKFKIRNESAHTLKFKPISINIPDRFFELQVLEPVGGFVLLPYNTVNVTIESKLSKEAVPSEEPIIYEFNLEALVEDLPEFDGLLGPFQLALKIEELMPCPDYIALDFGTSTSAAVYNGECIPLEGIDTKILSNIIILGYTPNEEPKFNYLIGTKAKRMGTTVQKRPFLIKAVKLKINDPRFKSITLPFPHIQPKVTPDELAELIFRELFIRIQRSIRQKPQKVILSLPTRFSIDQRRKIVDACSRSWELKEIITVDESVAVGLFYILGRGLTDFPSRTYKMMVIDFGGGTTDVTVFIVENKGPCPENIEKIEIIASWGDPTLGGEKLTQNIAKILAKKFIAKVEGRGRSPAGEEIRQLEDEAEEAKVLIAEADNWLGEKVPGDIAVSEAEEQARRFFEERLKSEDFSVRFEDIRLKLFRGESEDGIVSKLAKLLSDGEITVVSEDYPTVTEGVQLSYREIIEVYEANVLPFLGELETMLELIGSPELDIVLLAGQSCRFDKVKEWVMNKNFAKVVDFVRDFEGKPLLKESVARGAFLYCNFIGPVVRLDGINRVWRRLGILEGKEKFKEILPFNAKPGEEKEFTWVRIEETLSIYEHPKLTGDEKPKTPKFKEFILPPDVPWRQQLMGKVKLEENGDISLWYKCKKEDPWVKLIPKGGL